MDLPINIDPDLQYAAKLPHAFLNHLLETGYQFDQGPLCLKITGGFGSCYCGMTEFKPVEHGCAVDIGYEINQHLNLMTGEHVHIEHVPAQMPYLIKVQGHRDSFGKVTDIKEQLEKQLVNMRVLNKGTELIVDGPDGPEPFTVVELVDAEEKPMLWGLMVDADVKVDFLKTRETIEREEAELLRKEEELLRKEQEKSGFYGTGHRLGSSSQSPDQDQDPRARRQAWLDRLQNK